MFSSLPDKSDEPINRFKLFSITMKKEIEKRNLEIAKLSKPILGLMLLSTKDNGFDYITENLTQDILNLNHHNNNVLISYDIFSNKVDAALKEDVEKFPADEILSFDECQRLMKPKYIVGMMRDAIRVLAFQSISAEDKNTLDTLTSKLSGNCLSKEFFSDIFKPVMILSEKYPDCKKTMLEMIEVYIKPIYCSLVAFCKQPTIDSQNNSTLTIKNT